MFVPGDVGVVHGFVGRIFNLRREYEGVRGRLKACPTVHSIPARWQSVADMTGCGQLQTRKNNASRHQRPAGCPTIYPVPLAAESAACDARSAIVLARKRKSSVEQAAKPAA